MRESIINSVKLIVHDRATTAVFAGLILLSSLLALYFGVKISPSDIQVYTHYTSFGGVNFYATQWYYALAYSLFFVVIAVMHTAVGAKLYSAKGRVPAIGFAWLSIGVVLFAAVMLHRILGIAFSF